MCTNRALVNSLECYMDDLVDCFEDFVKKSVIVISIAVGLLVGAIAYVLKIIVDRNQTVSTTGPTHRNSLTLSDSQLARIQSEQVQRNTSDISLKNNKSKRRSSIVEKRNSKASDNEDDKLTSNASVNTATDQPSGDETVLKDIAFNSSGTKTVCRGCFEKSTNSSSKTRLTIPSLPTGPKCNLPCFDRQGSSKSVEKLESCCSMCCNERGR